MRQTQFSLPHALLVVVPPHADALVAARSYSTATDTRLEITPHKKQNGTSIGIFVDDVRDIQQAVRTSRPQARTLVLIADAHRLTQQAQNALLKLLEEPRDSLHIILATPQPSLLLETVRSRCQTASYTPTVQEVPLPSDIKAKVEFMSDGDTLLQQKLLQDTAFYEEEVAIFAKAKQFVSGTPLERLAVIATVKDSRDTALRLLHAALVVCRFMLLRQASPELHAKTTSLLAAEDSIRKNAHVRISLLRCVV